MRPKINERKFQNLRIFARPREPEEKERENSFCRVYSGIRRYPMVVLLLLPMVAAVGCRHFSSALGSIDFEFWFLPLSIHLSDSIKECFYLSSPPEIYVVRVVSLNLHPLHEMWTLIRRNIHIHFIQRHQRETSMKFDHRMAIANENSFQFTQNWKIFFKLIKATNRITQRWEETKIMRNRISRSGQLLIEFHRKKVPLMCRAMPAPM